MSDKKEILEQVLNTINYCKITNFTAPDTFAILEEWASDKMEKLDAYEKSGLPKYIHWKDVLEMNLDSSTKYIPVKLGSMHCTLIIFDANEVRHADLQYISSRFLRFDSNDFDERLCLFDDLNLETLEDIY